MPFGGSYRSLLLFVSIPAAVESVGIENELHHLVGINFDQASILPDAAHQRPDSFGLPSQLPSRITEQLQTASQNINQLAGSLEPSWSDAFKFATSFPNDFSNMESPLDPTNLSGTLRTGEESHIYDELPITYQAHSKTQHSSHPLENMENPTSFPRTTPHGEINTSVDGVFKRSPDFMRYDFDCDSQPPWYPIQSSFHLLSNVGSSEAAPLINFRPSKKSQLPYSKQEQSNQLITENGPGIEIGENDPEKALGGTDSGSIKLQTMPNCWASREENESLTIGGRFTFERLDFDSEVFARNIMLTTAYEQEKRQALISLANFSPKRRLFINEDDIKGADEIFRALRGKSMKTKFARAKRGPVEKDHQPNRNIKRDMIRESKQKFFDKLSQWFVFWAERTGKKILAEVRTVPALPRSKLVGLYLFYIEMINEIIPPNKTNVDDHQSGELILEALKIFEKFEWKSNKMYGKSSNQKAFDQVLWNFLENWLRNTKRQKLKDIFIRKQGQDILNKYDQDTKGKRKQSKINRMAVKKLAKSFFNDVFCYSIDSLNEKIRSINVKFQQKKVMRGKEID